MALTTAGLANGGRTINYQFQYDDSQAAPLNPGGPEPARTNSVMAACEGDFQLMSGWFGNIAPGVNSPIAVNVIPPGAAGACATSGACWGTSNGNLTVTLSLNGLTAVTARYLIVSEIVEVFMSAQNTGWFGQGTEGSQGEGLSRFLAAQFLAANRLGNPPPGFYNSNSWLASPRTDFVNNINPADDGPDSVTGCSLLFIYYLFSQLGFSINAIVGAGASTLAGVYRKLTRTSADPFPAFLRVLGIYFPGAGTITKGNLDNPFPLPDPPLTSPGILWHNSTTRETQIWLLRTPRIAGRPTVTAEDGKPILINAPWSIAGVSDFTHSGNADILWHNDTAHETQIWRMNGSRIAARATVTGEDGQVVRIGPPFRIVGASDRSRDGMAEILWHNDDTGETQAWILRGTRVTGRQTVLAEDGRPFLVKTPWSVAGANDFSGDGVSDVLWHNSITGETQIWFLNGAHGTHSVARRATVVDENGGPLLVGEPWSIVGTQDFSGDGIPDILWHNSTTGETQIWFLNGRKGVHSLSGRATVVAEAGQPILIGTPWRVAGAGKFASQLPWPG